MLYPTQSDRNLPQKPRIQQGVQNSAGAATRPLTLPTFLTIWQRHRGTVEAPFDAWIGPCQIPRIRQQHIYSLLDAVLPDGAWCIT